MPDFMAPGVPAEETSSGPPPIDGIDTSIAGFVGATNTGPAESDLELLTSVADFERHYGSGADLIYTDDTRTPNFMWHAARAFFAGSSRRSVSPARRIAATLISLAWAKPDISPVTPRRPKPESRD